MEWWNTTPGQQHAPLGPWQHQDKPGEKNMMKEVKVLLPSRQKHHNILSEGMVTVWLTGTILPGTSATPSLSLISGQYYILVEQIIDFLINNW